MVADTPDTEGPSDAEKAERKRFRVMAGAGGGVVLLLAYFALTLGSNDDAGVVVAAPATDATAVAAATPAEAEATSAPLPPGVSGGAAGGGGLGGGGGGATSAPGPTVPAGADRKAVEERYVSQGLPARAAAALADSSARRKSASAKPVSNGPVRAARATSLMIGPGSGSSSVTVPTGVELQLSGCETHRAETWCRASVNGITGWVRQSDVSRAP